MQKLFFPIWSGVQVFFSPQSQFTLELYLGPPVFVPGLVSTTTRVPGGGFFLFVWVFLFPFDLLGCFRALGFGYNFLGMLGDGDFMWVVAYLWFPGFSTRAVVFTKNRVWVVGGHPFFFYLVFTSRWGRFSTLRGFPGEVCFEVFFVLFPFFSQSWWGGSLDYPFLGPIPPQGLFTCFFFLLTPLAICF